MTKYLANWEVESDVILPEGIPFLRYDHPAATYTAFLRNIPETRHDLTYLSMQIVFDAPSLKDAQKVGEPLAKEFLDYLSFMTHLKLRLRDIRQIFDWERDSAAGRDAIYFTPNYAHDDAPYDMLTQPVLDTITMLQQQPTNPRLRRALKWFSNGVSSQYYDDQFAYFWFVIELVAQLMKDTSPVPDRCTTCHTPMYCPTCESSPLHRPYPKQAIQQLFGKFVKDPTDIFYRHATEARNMLMHGDEVSAVEQKLGIDFAKLVDHLGRLAWAAIFNQYTPGLVGKTPFLIQTNQYVHMNMLGAAFVQTGFAPNFDNPDPAHFPKIDFTVEFSRRSPPTEPDMPAEE